MELNEHILAQFDSFLKGEISIEERVALERQLEENPALAKALEEHKIARNALELYKEIELKKYLRNKHAQRKSRRFAWWQLAAAIVLLLIIGVSGYLYQRTQYSNEALFASHFVPFQDDNTLKGTDLSTEAEQKILQEGIKTFDQQAYSEAEYIFKQLMDSSATSLRARFYLAQIHLTRSDYVKAIGILQEIEEQSALYKQDIRWYLSLAFIGNGEGEKAQAYLDLLASEGGLYYQTKAIKLQADLVSFWR